MASPFSSDVGTPGSEGHAQLSRRSLVAGASAVGALIGVAPAAGAAPSAPSVVWPSVKRPADLSRIVAWSAAELSVAIRRRTVTCVEVMSAYLDRIEAVNPKVNAIVALRPRAELLEEAAGKDRLLAAGTYQGWMHGFPQAAKDLANVKGMPTSLGFFGQPGVPAASPATADALVVERMRSAGAIFIGKTNTPEFGLGSHTYNNVFGTTFNAYDQSRSAGGSSGGAAVAVALRMLPVADGSDFFGSLRNPPGWNNVLGLRPSYGRVPGVGNEQFVQQGGTEGPIARTATDLALFLDTLAGYDVRAPLSIERDVELRQPGKPGKVSMRGHRVAWMADLGGYLPMDPEVLEVTGAAVHRMRGMGIEVDKVDALPTAPGFAGNADLWPTWLVFRHWLIGGILKPLHDNPQLREKMKPEAIYEVEGLLTGADGNPAISGIDAWNGSVKRTAMYQAFRQLFETYDYVVLPTAQIFPFDAEETWPKQIHGTAMSSYHRWMEVTAIGTLLGAPTLAVPGGFSGDGLPIGLQVIGRNHDDAGVLDFAAAWERETRFVEDHLPPLIAR
ncbi:amidase [Nocardioides sp. YR527]|uniref:amidase n=1 Tax=Nocardioides sp. YR527 TaxID=1881028 RepID=UPI00088C333A|nr:amidase [Nocardioides sp. YR527]SDK66304.1 amidase [Nocardioides sp. YR527]